MRKRKIFISLFEFLIVLCAWGGISQSYCQGQWEELCYFTYQTNFLVGVVYLWSAIATLTGKRRPWPWLRGLALVFIFVTGLVANTILPAPDYATEYRAYGFIPNTLLVHITVPLLCLIHFILFERHKHYKWWFPLTWPLCIYAWFDFIVIRADIFPHAGVDPGSHNPWPYWFINVNKVGWASIPRTFLLFTIFFLILGYILFIADHFLPRTAVVKTTTEEEIIEYLQTRKMKKIQKIATSFPQIDLSHCSSNKIK